ncbi:helix-turn-helix transcriptional regulator [Pantoea sp. Ap-967]|uniref:helix-turn-helix transcriptional regulator n=1 Tax=Pantoea sp. Ap-967 TaxID=2608362 RepID=UPI00141D9198|nr:AraC family transcriptional regulator [Pantoea sp. Ap-967]
MGGFSFRHVEYRDWQGKSNLSSDEFTFLFPDRGVILMNNITGTPGLAISTRKSDITAVQYHHNHRHLGCSISERVISERLSILLEKPAMDTIHFEQIVNLDKLKLTAIKSMITFATGLELADLINSNAFTPARVKEMLVDSILLSWPNNYCAALNRPTKAPSPRHVKIATEYIRENFRKCITGEELARLSNVSLRSLQMGFKQFEGLTIIAYQRKVRLEHAHQLLSSGTVSSVNDVALMLGFGSSGRFCQYFRQAYGVTPAELQKRFNFSH